MGKKRERSINVSDHHGNSLSTHLSKILSAVVRRLRDPDSSVRSACVAASLSHSSRITPPYPLHPFSISCYKVSQLREKQIVNPREREENPDLGNGGKLRHFFFAVVHETLRETFLILTQENDAIPWILTSSKPSIQLNKVSKICCQDKAALIRSGQQWMFDDLTAQMFGTKHGIPKLRTMLTQISRGM